MTMKNIVHYGACGITLLSLAALAAPTPKRLFSLAIHASPAKPSLALVIAAESTTVNVGQPVSVRTVLTNKSKQPFDASGCYCGPAGLDSLFTWEVRDNGHLTPKRMYPHPELATGEIILDRVVPPRR